MRYFTKDHPRCRSPQGAMSCDEIRYWIIALRKAYGWKSRALSRFLGFIDDGAMTSKLRSSWIYPGEQIRVSKQLRRIISGEVVCAKVSESKWKTPRYEGVVATNPVPLRRPMHLKICLKTGRVRYVANVEPARNPAIPSFGTALGG